MAPTNRYVLDWFQRLANYPGISPRLFLVFLAYSPGKIDFKECTARLRIRLDRLRQQNQNLQQEQEQLKQNLNR